MCNVGYEQEEEFQVPIFAAKGLDVGITHHLVSDEGDPNE